MVALGLKWMWNPESPFYIKPRLSRELFDWGFKFWRASTASHVKRCAPLLRDLSFASRELFEELAAIPDHDFSLVKRGLLMLCKTGHALDDEAKVAKQANDLGVPAEVLDARETALLDPSVRMDVAGSVYFPKDCHLSPARFMQTLQTECEASGVTFAWNTRVTAFEREGNRIRAAQTTEGSFAGDEFVLCGGSWSPVISRELGLKIPMQAGKGYSLTLPKPRQLPQLCSIFCEARVAVTPMNGALRFGGTMEIAGMSESINVRRVRGIVNSVPKYFPEFSADDFSNITPWAGLRPCSPDGMPYIGRTGRFGNLTLATGHEMMGLSLAPVTGRLVSQIIDHEPTSIDISLLSPDRFG